jgi:hypothetical protein
VPTEVALGARENRHSGCFGPAFFLDRGDYDRSIP